MIIFFVWLHSSVLCWLTCFSMSHMSKITGEVPRGPTLIVKKNVLLLHKTFVFKVNYKMKLRHNTFAFGKFHNCHAFQIN